MYKDNMKLIMFKKAHELAKLVYKLTDSFPEHELYGLTSQMRRAVISIPSNIAEGKARGSSKDYKRFLLIARGSLEELKYQMFFSLEIGYIDEEDYEAFESLSEEVGKLTYYTMKKLNV